MRNYDSVTNVTSRGKAASSEGPKGGSAGGCGCGEGSEAGIEVGAGATGFLSIV